MKNPLLVMAVDMVNAVGALRLGKSDRLVNVPEGVEIHHRGRPALLLTHDNARRFSQERQEAEYG